jgi:flagella synthesis protein FlgN
VTRRDAFSRVFAGMRADLHAYRELRQLLEDQFRAALEHRSADIRDIGERITALAAEIEERRRERVELVTLLTPQNAQARMASIAERLQGSSRAAFDTCWRALEGAVRECKDLNLRNCRLIMDQHAIMQRVLNAESDTYAPA